MPGLPQIRIRDAWLLRQNVSVHLNELWGEGKPIATDEWIEKRVEAYTKAWQPYEKKILIGLQELTGLTFRQNIIDVYIAPWFKAFSEPLVIGVTRDPDVFIDTLTHELIHRLLTDNTTLSFDTKLMPRWKKLFGKELSFGTVVHIPVHALLEAVYIDVLKEPARLERDIASCKKYAEDYSLAWKYVKDQSYKEIINKLKADYANGD